MSVTDPGRTFPVFPRYRGKQALIRGENRLGKCVAYGPACPVGATFMGREYNRVSATVS